MRSIRLLLFSLSLVAGISFIGCGNKTKFAEVEARVTLDGKPLSNGSVRLVPVDGAGPTAGATIKDGQFTTRLSKGNYRVEIAAVAAPPDGTPKSAKHRYEVGLPDTQELIPAKYNVRSELAWELQEGENSRTFELTSR